MGVASPGAWALKVKRYMNRKRYLLTVHIQRIVETGSQESSREGISVARDHSAGAELSL